MSKIVSVWEHGEGLGLLFVTDEPYDAIDTFRHSTEYVAALWIDPEHNFVARVPAFAIGVPRPYYSARIDSKSKKGQAK